MGPNERTSFQLCSVSSSANRLANLRSEGRRLSGAKEFLLLRRCFPGQHRSLGPTISKVRSLKLDSSIWSNELVEVR